MNQNNPQQYHIPQIHNNFQQRDPQYRNALTYLVTSPCNVNNHPPGQQGVCTPGEDIYVKYGDTSENNARDATYDSHNPSITKYGVVDSETLTHAWDIPNVNENASNVGTQLRLNLLANTNQCRQVAGTREWYICTANYATNLVTHWNNYTAQHQNTTFRF